MAACRFGSRFCFAIICQRKEPSRVGFGLKRAVSIRVLMFFEYAVLQQGILFKNKLNNKVGYFRFSFVTRYMQSYQRVHWPRRC